MTGTDNFVDMLVSGRKDTNKLERDISGRGVINIFKIFPRQFVQCKVKRVKVEKRTYDEDNDVLILGHPQKGILGTNKLGTEAEAFGAWSTEYDSGDL